MPESFILQTYLSDLSICDDLIAFHETNPSKVDGLVQINGESVVDKRYKDSEESHLLGHINERYNAQLQEVVDAYIAKYPECNMGGPWSVIEPPQIQKYVPGGGYFQWHSERTGAHPRIVSTRHLVFMTYLNDVTDAGETEFLYQKVKVQPRRGLTLIWPADWTFTHKGITSPTQEKYIVTGWFNYI